MLWKAFGEYLGRATNQQAEIIAAAVGLGWDRQLGNTLPLSKTTVSKPDRDKWRRAEQVIRSVWPIELSNVRPRRSWVMARCL